MAKKKKEGNYKEMDEAELDRQLENFRQSLFKLRFRAASTSLKNVMAIRDTRRDIARLFTFLGQKKRGLK